MFENSVFLKLIREKIFFLAKTKKTNPKNPKQNKTKQSKKNKNPKQKYEIRTY